MDFGRALHACSDADKPCLATACWPPLVWEHRDTAGHLEPAESDLVGRTGDGRGASLARATLHPLARVVGNGRQVHSWSRPACMAEFSLLRATAVADLQGSDLLYSLALRRRFARCPSHLHRPLHVRSVCCVDGGSSICPAIAWHTWRSVIHA